MKQKALQTKYTRVLSYSGTELNKIQLFNKNETPVPKFYFMLN